MTCHKPFENKTIVITGARTGIGFALAKHFHNLGANLGLISRSIQKKQFNELNAPDRLSVYAGDIGEESTVKDAFKQFLDRFNSIDVLINNAGVLHLNPIETYPLTDIQQDLTTNILGPFLACKEAFLTMNNGGSIINVSSLAGIKGVEKFAGMSGYIASKFAIIGLTESLAVEGKAKNIRVNAIAPGAVTTPMLEKAFPDFPSVTEPQDIVGAFEFLANEALSGKITGEVIEIHCNN